MWMAMESATLATCARLTQQRCNPVLAAAAFLILTATAMVPLTV
jgi:hypothetical protein